MSDTEKKPYTAPKLTPLGKVAELTASGSGCRGPHGQGRDGNGDCGRPHQ